MKAETNFQKINKQVVFKVKDLHFKNVDDFNYTFVALNKCYLTIGDAYVDCQVKLKEYKLQGEQGYGYFNKINLINARIFNNLQELGNYLQTQGLNPILSDYIIEKVSGFKLYI